MPRPISAKSKILLRAVNRNLESALTTMAHVPTAELVRMRIEYRIFTFSNIRDLQKQIRRYIRTRQQESKNATQKGK